MNFNKILQICLGLCVCLATTHSLNAQDNKNKITIGSGLAASTMKDKVISTFIYNRKSLPVLGEYLYKDEKNIFAIHFYGLSQKLYTDENKGFTYSGDLGTFVPDKVNGLKHSQVNFFLFQTRIQYLRRVHLGDKFSLGIGGYVGGDIIRKRFLVLDYENKLKEHFISIGPQLMPAWESGKHGLKYSIAASVFNSCARTLKPREGQSTVVSNTSLFKNYFGLESRLSYEYKLSKSIGLDVNYIYYYYQYEAPKKEQMAIQNLTVGLSFLF